MMAALGLPPRSAGWAWELKYDGIRALAHLGGDRLRLYTRNGNEVARRYPELRAMPDAIAVENAVLDGEVVALDERGRPSFEMLQQRMHVDDPNAIRRLVQSVPVVYMLFDILWLNGESVMTRRYDERRALLVALDANGHSWRTPPNEEGDGAATREVSERFGLEGVVAKRRDSIYEGGQRSRNWIKVKYTMKQEFVVGGWMPGEKGRAGTVGSLLIGYNEGEGDARVLRYAARVGSGLRGTDLEYLDRVLAERARATNPFQTGTPPRGARFVEPDLVVEVRFTEWTQSGGVRAPVFLGYRDDKPADEVEREVPSD
jgi:bifunctional non-homologous end joining protein LigD